VKTQATLKNVARLLREKARALSTLEELSESADIAFAHCSSIVWQSSDLDELATLRARKTTSIHRYPAHSALQQPAKN
jgi:hypothetical protein